MEGKKKFLENFRLKTKLPNIKKPRKKLLAKQPRNLAIRRSISVPDLTSLQVEASSGETDALGTPSEVINFGTSPGQSDTDSVASGSVSEGPLFAEKLSHSVSDIQYRIHNINLPSANRLSAPPAYEDEVYLKTSSPESKRNVRIEGFSPQEHRKPKKNMQKFTFEPIKEPESNQAEKESVPEEEPYTRRRMSDAVAAILNRANSMGEEKRLHTEKKTVMFDTKKPTSEKLTIQTSRPNSSTDRLSLEAQFDNADAFSLYSACVTPSEDQVNMLWPSTWDEEDLEQVSSSSLHREMSMDDSLLDLENPDESLEENSAETFEYCDDFDDNNAEGTDTLLPGTDAPTPSRFQRYLLNINLKYGRNLVIRSRRAGSSDPYVKFKLEGKQFYKSKVVYKDLNPRWNESFSHPLRDRNNDVELRVYDKNLTADDFMGSSTISLKNLELHKTHELELHLEDPKSKEDDMGVIVLEVRLNFRDATVKRGNRFRPKKKQQNQGQTPRTNDPSKNQLKSQMWTGVFQITLVEGLHMPQCGHGDVYVRFRLGDQKYKSKNLCIQPNPQWREQFDFNKFDDVLEPLQVEVCAKRRRKGTESWGVFEIDVLKFPLNERMDHNYVLNPGKGKLVFLVTLRPCWGVSISDAENPTIANQDEKDAVVERLSLKNSHKCLQDVGFLQISVLKANDLPATDINGKSNPFVVVELGNCKLQTRTVSRSVNPDWNTIFTFPIKDIHDVVEVTVFDENGDKSPNFLGKAAIPLLTVESGQPMCLFLKKECLEKISKGTITLVLEVIYNKVRAGVKTFQPKEAKFTEENSKFNKKILARNIYRVRKISTAVLYTLQYIKSCFQWESRQRSIIAFLIFLVTVWHWELFMLPLFLLLLIGWNYTQLSRELASSNQDLVNMAMGDDEEEDEKEPGKKGLIDKIHMVQEVVLVVQNVLEEIANIGERVKNIFNWSVPFMSFLACLVLFVTASLLYLIPLRYIVLVWGINKFTKKLRNPYCIDSNEILDFLQRVPSDIQKVQYSVLRAPTGQNQPRKKK
ncbi:multiple C2 and transmembrane domain-containing protein 2 isoform X1 [Poecilia formosa]|uniref:Multiple C2 domains, transmembrane 2a n=1 Tax=Poecilia formosa TaxID=48698 RepID=A0A087YMS9_POEFO|nr:PREDICTED: multiple C2 and transmembrane domain-containing protein 2 isoform X1 [Poecilia formosa]XP_007545807.1 PREDICTED: multiple C2 and transmembrane domain-containing protein 2 isoform X1 [Poecilia formosa]XP_016523706.1 PREDICTED: multiple C2 and transmembrane domain-containing protein 2 isoform X1 [Poecilia formosa]